MNLNLFYLYLIVGLYSLAIGSFLNVLIYRLPFILQKEWLHECRLLMKMPLAEENKPLNLFLPRSFCPSCKKTIKAIHNIPVLSYLFLRGRCAYCKTTIPLRYPFVELLTCFLSLLVLWHFGFGLKFAFALLFVWLLIPMFFIDVDYQLLPDSLTLGLLWVGLIANTQNLFTTLPNAVLSAAGAYLFLWLFIKLFYLLTGKIGMGNGDFKLFAAFGAWFGWIELPLILFVASLSGAIVGTICLKIQNKTRNTPIAFAPYLCIAGLIALFLGPWIIKWYLELLF